MTVCAACRRSLLTGHVCSRPTHPLAGAACEIPTAGEELRLAAWHLGCGLDRLSSDGLAHHPGVRSHSEAARAQLVAVIGLLDQER